MKKYTTTTYNIDLKKPDMEQTSVKAVYITDLHNSIWNNDEDYLPELISEQKPDIILCGGDMLVAHPDEDVDIALRFMRRMLDIAPVYFSLGNHEFRSRIYKDVYGDMYEAFMKPLIKEGMKLLVNKCAEVFVKGAQLNIYGLEIPRRNYKRLANVPFPLAKMEKYLGRPDEEKVSILLAHNPKYHKTYKKWRADITLCGHYHGGIMRFTEHVGAISPGLMPFTPIAHGRFDYGDKTMIISGGLGEHTLPIRINNPRELVVLNININ